MSNRFGKDSRRQKAETRFRDRVLGLLGRKITKQYTHTSAVKPRGRLSGAIAKTAEGQTINALRSAQVVITANNVTGQIGPWFKRKGQ